MLQLQPAWGRVRRSTVAVRVPHVPLDPEASRLAQVRCSVALFWKGVVQFAAARAADCARPNANGPIAEDETPEVEGHARGEHRAGHRTTTPMQAAGAVQGIGGGTITTPASIAPSSPPSWTTGTAECSTSLSSSGPHALNATTITSRTARITAPPPHGIALHRRKHQVPHPGRAGSCAASPPLRLRSNRATPEDPRSWRPSRGGA